MELLDKAKIKASKVTVSEEFIDPEVKSNFLCC